MGKTTIKICKVCGAKMKLNALQHRKIICSKCSYKLKKTRITAKYFLKKDPNSQKSKYWNAQLEALESLMKK